MADTQDQHIQDLIGRADEAIRIARRSLEEGDDKLRALGLDPEKVRATLDAQPMTAEQRDEAQALFRQDMQAIQSHAEQESAYARQRSEPRASAGAAKRPRNLV
ncbi:hypothetical protein [Achromobacter sp. Bel]|uniref:hypothetical protein n=1 Tax=Achromobacter sp. Bel TaxID=2727415 RepID=UPI00145DCEC0|nr:hypothetical protein [Achromobacter sp. Bel]NMK47574.1 hypothetical protein [Achromobacter sp. Bel]